MKKIAIIGASELQNPLIEKAKEMGLETHVFAWECGDIGERTADFFYPISIIEKEQILEKCREIQVDAVTTIASDLGNVVANYVARELGLSSNSEYCTLSSTNKYEMRKAFQKNLISVPDYYEISDIDSLDNLKTISFPVIVKPTDRSGSRGITKVGKFDDLQAAIEEAINYSFENKAIVEEFIEGNEYSMECISYDGKHTMLAVTKKYTTGAPHFIEMGHMEPSDLDEETIEKAKEEIFKALNALDVKIGASHSEFIIDANTNVKIIEIGSRMGGDCIGSDLVRLSTGYDFTKMVIQTALGEKPDLTRNEKASNAAIKYIFTEKDFEKLETIKKTNPDILVKQSNIEINQEKEIVDSSSRYGFFIIKNDDKSIIQNIIEE